MRPFSGCPGNGIVLLVFCGLSTPDISHHRITDRLADRTNNQDPVLGDGFEGDPRRLPYGFLKMLCALMNSRNSPQVHKPNAVKRGSLPLSLASFVSGSGKMVLGPAAIWQGSVKIQLGYNALPNIVKAVMCGRLNTMSAKLRMEIATDSPRNDMVAMLAELLLIYRWVLFDDNSEVLLTRTLSALFLMTAAFSVRQENCCSYQLAAFMPSVLSERCAPGRKTSSVGSFPS